MDRITKGYLNDFAKKFQIEGAKDDILFEHFSNYTLSYPFIKDEMKNLELESINIGLDSNIGIDGFLLIIGGNIIKNIEELEECLEDKTEKKANIIFIQSKTSKNIALKDFTHFVTSVKDFLSEQPRQIWTDTAKEKIKLIKKLIDNYIKLEQQAKCKLYYVSLGEFQEDENISSRINMAIEDIKKLKIFSEVEVEIIDADKIQEKYRSIGKNFDAMIKFSEDEIYIPDIKNVEQAYIGIVKCKDIIEIISNQNNEGNILHQIFYDNVRDYQGDKGVNQKISETIKDSDLRNSFILLNNGITIVAEKINPIKKRVYNIKNFQIINGCQTSHVLFENRKNLTDDMYLTVKLIITQDKLLTSKIIHSTNNQTSIKDEDLIAFTEFHKKLEDYYNTFDGDEKLYYERRSKQYSNANISISKIINKTQQIKSIASFYEGKPQLAARFFGALFKEFKDKLFKDKHNMQAYYISSLALYKIEQMLNKKQIDKKYNKIRYHILMMLRYEITLEKFSGFNKNKDLDKYLKSIYDVLKDENQLNESIKRIINKIDSLKVDLTSNELSKNGQFVQDCLSFYSKKY